MPTYDAARFHPPAPMAQVTLRNPDNNTTHPDVPMLLDTGADVTLIPKTIAERLEAHPSPDRQYELTSFDGSISLTPVVQLELFFLGRTFRGQFLLIDQEWGILGRNVLNAIPVLLDGPNLEWSEHHRK